MLFGAWKVFSWLCILTRADSRREFFLDHDRLRYWRRDPLREAADGETVSVGLGLVSRTVGWFGTGSHLVVGVGCEATCGRKGPSVFPTLKVCTGVRCFVLWSFSFVLLFLRRSRMHRRCWARQWLETWQLNDDVPVWPSERSSVTTHDASTNVSATTSGPPRRSYLVLENRHYDAEVALIRMNRNTGAGIDVEDPHRHLLRRRRPAGDSWQRQPEPCPGCSPFFGQFPPSRTETSSPRSSTQHVSLRGSVLLGFQLWSFQFQVFDPQVPRRKALPRATKSHASRNARSPAVTVTTARARAIPFNEDLTQRYRDPSEIAQEATPGPGYWDTRLTLQIHDPQTASACQNDAMTSFVLRSRCRPPEQPPLRRTDRHPAPPHSKLRLRPSLSPERVAFLLEDPSLDERHPVVAGWLDYSNGDSDQIIGTWRSRAVAGPRSIAAIATTSWHEPL